MSDLIKAENVQAFPSDPKVFTVAGFAEGTNHKTLKVGDTVVMVEDPTISYWLLRLSDNTLHSLYISGTFSGEYGVLLREQNLSMSKPKQKLCRTARWIRRYTMIAPQTDYATRGFSTDLQRLMNDTAHGLATKTMFGSILSLKMAWRDFIRAFTRRPKKQTN